MGTNNIALIYGSDTGITELVVSLITKKLNLELDVIEIKAVDHMLTPEKIPKYFFPLWHATTFLFPGWKDSWSLITKKPIGWKSNKDPKDIEGFTFNPRLK